MTDAPSMAGKYVLVTGGTAGIGKATATGLAALGARVGITGRDQGRAAAAAADIRAATGSRAVDIFAADMSAQTEVRRGRGRRPLNDVRGRSLVPGRPGTPAGLTPR